MKIYLVTVGSRGDHEPFRALALEAAASGHEVHFAHTGDFPTDPEAGYTEHELPGSFEALMAEGFSLLKSLASYRSVIKPMLEGMYHASTTQIIELKPDVVVYHPKVVTAATAAHSIGALAAIVEMFPTLTPTREFPAGGITVALPRWLNRASYRLVAAGLRGFGDPARALANDIGAIRTESDITLCPVSTVLVAQPHDWPDHARVTGWWSFPAAAEVDTELDEFLSSGAAIYAGFGSMNDGERTARARARAIVAAARGLGMKTLLVTGWGGLVVDEDLQGAPDVLVRSSVDHASVFPRVAAAIHHGGSGTTHQAVKAGTPSVIVPFLADQPWWAKRLHRAGLGPAALSRRTRSAARFRRAVQQAIGKSPAVELAARKMADEDGLGTAVQILEDAELGIGPIAPA